MNLLLDAHLLLWAASEPKRISAKARALLLDSSNQPIFSAASMWEISIKRSLERADFSVDPRRLWRMLQASGYRELAVPQSTPLPSTICRFCTKTRSIVSSSHKREWKACCC